MRRSIVACFTLFILAACRNQVALPTHDHALSVNLRQKIGQMLMVGFDGTTMDSPDVVALGQHIQKHHVGGVILYGHNVVNPIQIKALNTFLSSIPVPSPLLIALDQEGGKVCRLSNKKGFPVFLSAHDVAQGSVHAARAHYDSMAQTVSDAGFNVCLGPVVDLAYDQDCPDQRMNDVIGHLGRSYGPDPKTVVQYAGAYVDAFRQHRILTAIKHFPGHGLATGDTHIGMVDITATHKTIEHLPFYMLINQGKADMVMTAHLVDRNMDPDHPATLSHNMLTRLLRMQGYDGVLISDSLDMGAIKDQYTLEESVIKAVQAGVDILLISNKLPADQETKKRHTYFPVKDLINRVATCLERAVESGQISHERIQNSCDRILKMKRLLKK